MMQGPTSPVPIPGIAKRTTFGPPPHGTTKNGETGGNGYQIDLSQAHVMEELTARHSASAAAAAKAQPAAAHPQTPAQAKRPHSSGGDPPRSSSTGPVEPKKTARSLSPDSDFWRQQQRVAEPSASQGLQEVLVYSGHYASPLPPVPGGVKAPAAADEKQSRPRLTITTQSPHGSLASGLAGLAVSGGRSEFPVVPVEATLVKAVLLWTAGSAKSVEVKGSFDGWGPSRRLKQQPDDTWAICAYLSPGMYQYKYVVDSVWRYDPWAPVVRDEDGNLNNVLEVIDPCTSFDIPPDFDPPPSPVSSYAQELPASGELANEPPLLPPQAQLTPLDLDISAAAAWPEAGDPRPMHPAEHSVLNHAFIARSSRRSSASESELPKEPMILGCIIKHRAKTIVTLMYKPRSSSRHTGAGDAERLPSGAMPDINR